MSDRTGKFSLAEQIWMQLSFNGIWILGAMAMSSWSLLLSLGYIVLFPVFGVLIGLMHLWICPRCPHLKKCGSCVQMPPSLASRIIKKNVTGHLGFAEKVGFFVALYGVALAPLFWVIQNRSLGTSPEVGWARRRTSDKLFLLTNANPTQEALVIDLARQAGVKLVVNFKVPIKRLFNGEGTYDHGSVSHKRRGERTFLNIQLGYLALAGGTQ